MRRWCVERKILSVGIPVSPWTSVRQAIWFYLLSNFMQIYIAYTDGGTNVGIFFFLIIKYSGFYTWARIVINLWEDGLPTNPFIEHSLFPKLRFYDLHMFKIIFPFVFLSWLCKLHQLLFQVLYASYLCITTVLLDVVQGSWPCSAQFSVWKITASYLCEITEIISNLILLGWFS